MKSDFDLCHIKVNNKGIYKINVKERKVRKNSRGKCKIKFI